MKVVLCAGVAYIRNLTASSQCLILIHLQVGEGVLKSMK